jgi:hypothetical protein
MGGVERAGSQGILAAGLRLQGGGFPTFPRRVAQVFDFAHRQVFGNEQWVFVAAQNNTDMTSSIFL